MLVCTGVSRATPSKQPAPRARFASMRSSHVCKAATKQRLGARLTSLLEYSRRTRRLCMRCRMRLRLRAASLAMPSTTREKRCSFRFSDMSRRSLSGKPSASSSSASRAAAASSGSTWPRGAPLQPGFVLFLYQSMGLSNKTLSTDAPHSSGVPWRVLSLNPSCITEDPCAHAVHAPALMRSRHTLAGRSMPA